MVSSCDLVATTFRSWILNKTPEKARSLDLYGGHKKV
jgi:hypothetical protein